jgi:hypothetical protein
LGKTDDRSFFLRGVGEEKAGFGTRWGRCSILSILARFACLPVLCYRSFFDNPIKPFDGDNWNSIFDKSGGKVVKIFEKSFFLVVNFGNFG